MVEERVRLPLGLPWTSRKNRQRGRSMVRDALRKCLKDPDWWVRCAAIDALAQHAGEPRSEDCQSGPQGQSSQ